MTGRSKSVQVTASVEPGAITLHFAPSYYRISRKALDVQVWDVIWNRPIGDNYVDTAVITGNVYEYRIEDLNSQGATAYVAVNFGAPAPRRGKVLLVVSPLIASALDAPITRLTQDLTNEGWSVETLYLTDGETPASVKAALVSAAPDAAFFIGNVPVFRSGNYSYDGHADHHGSVAADTYYGDLTGDWTARPNEIPGELTVAVGRVDFSRMTCFANKTPARGEVDLTRAYLDKNHAFRAGQWDIPSRAVVCDNFPDRDFSSNAWRNFPQLVGEVIEIPGGQFFSNTRINGYLLGFACGGGQFVSMNGVGSSDDFATKDISPVFLGLLGSYFLDWNNESNFLRASLGSGKILAAFGAGAPNVFLHRLAVGGTIGESFILSANNGSLYPPTGNIEKGLYEPANSIDIPPAARKVHQALMGDPTLVLFPRRATTPIPTPLPPIVTPTPQPSMSTVKYIEADVTTKGTWIGKRGALGQVIATLAPKPPAGVTVLLANKVDYAWNEPGSDLRALQLPGEPTKRLAPAWYDDNGFTVAVGTNDQVARRLAIYFLDWDKLGRRQKVEILDNNGTILDSRVVSSFQDGIYFVYDFVGPIVVRISRQGPGNTVAMGLFFDSTAPLLPVTPTPGPVVPPIPPVGVIRVTVESRDGGKTFQII